MLTTAFDGAVGKWNDCRTAGRSGCANEVADVREEYRKDHREHKKGGELGLTRSREDTKE